MAGRGRNPANAVLAAGLAAGKTVRDAAVAAGVSERTAGRRLRSRAFQARVARLRNRMVSAAAGRLADSMTAAVETLRDLLDATDPDTRSRAADRILRHALRVNELADLSLRVMELERRQRQQEQQQGQGKP